MEEKSIKNYLVFAFLSCVNQGTVESDETREVDICGQNCARFLFTHCSMHILVLPCGSDYVF